MTEFSIQAKRENTLNALHAYLFLFVVMAGKSVRQCLQSCIGKASEGRHSCDQQHALGQADDQCRGGKTHHTAQIDRPGPEEMHQPAHDQREEG